MQDEIPAQIYRRFVHQQAMVPVDWELCYPVFCLILRSSSLFSCLHFCFFVNLRIRNIKRNPNKKKLMKIVLISLILALILCAVHCEQAYFVKLSIDPSEKCLIIVNEPTSQWIEHLKDHNEEVHIDRYPRATFEGTVESKDEIIEIVGINHSIVWKNVNLHCKQIEHLHDTTEGADDEVVR